MDTMDRITLSAQPGVATGVDERTDSRYRPDAGDAERFAHIVFSPGRDGAAAVLEARVAGTPVEALCGKRWIPRRDPRRFPLCPDCKEIVEQAGLQVPLR